MKTNAIKFTKGNSCVIYFAEGLKLSAEQRAWLHSIGIRKDKWEPNKYFIMDGFDILECIDIGTKVLKAFRKLGMDNIAYNLTVGNFILGISNKYGADINEVRKSVKARLNA